MNVASMVLFLRRISREVWRDEKISRGSLPQVAILNYEFCVLRFDFNDNPNETSVLFFGENDKGKVRMRRQLDCGFWIAE